MKKIYFAFHGLFRPEIDVIYARAIESVSGGAHDVHVISCGGGISCPSNPLALRTICSLCHERSAVYRDLLLKTSQGTGAKVEFHEIDVAGEQRKLSVPRLRTEITDLRSVMYSGQDSGYATLSTYIDLTRDYEPSVANPIAARLLNSLHQGYASCFEATKKVIDVHRPDEIHVFNGRLTTSRAVLRAGQLLGVPTQCHEFVKGTNRLEIYFNSLPHDLGENRRRIEELYKRYKGDGEYIAATFYDAKIRGTARFDKNYVIGQSPGELPASWDAKKRNVVIFSSSEDEFQAIGKEWEDRLFKNQIEGVLHICEVLKGRADVYLRVHPNVAGASRKYKKKLEFLKTLDGLVFIDPKSKISSYALMEMCDLVITFGSTVGIEAAYKRKPSIVLGPSFYSELGATYRPKSIAQLDDMLNNQSLMPLPAEEGATKYAIYASRRGEECEYFHPAGGNDYTVNQNLIRFQRFKNFRYLISKMITRGVLKLASL